MPRRRDDSKPVQVDAASFNAAVLRSRRPVLAAFLATWSRPCQMLEPVLDEIASACCGRLKVARIDADENPDLSLLYDIQSIPTLLHFVAGTVRWRIVGTVGKAAVLSRLELPEIRGAVSSGTSITRRAGQRSARRPKAAPPRTDEGGHDG